MRDLGLGTVQSSLQYRALLNSLGPHHARFVKVVRAVANHQ